MNAFRFYLKSAIVIGIAALWLSACGGHGMVPTPAEQTQLQSAAAADPTGQPFSQTLSRHGFGHVLRGITLSAQQQSRLQTMVQQFRQAHPPGSAFDPQALQALHENMFAVLTPQQQAQFQQNMAQMRGGMHSINLTDAQRTQIRQLVQQFRLAHPQGSAVDEQARAQLHEQIRSVLTTQQQAQLKQNFSQWHNGGFRQLDLTDDQRSRIHALMQQYRQAHPRGSTFDPQARQQLRDQIRSLLTPQQRMQLEGPATAQPESSH